MYRNKTARQHNFATVPRADIPRSKFRMRQTRKQAFDASDLVPVMVEEMLPGDVWSHTEHIMARLATPIAPAVDDIDLETFYFYVPNRLVWSDWEDFITGSNDELTIPQLQPVNDDSSATMIKPNGLLDHMGLLPQTYSVAFTVNAMPVFAYFKIWNEWFRDQNLLGEFTWTEAPALTSLQITTPTAQWSQFCLPTCKRHDYFTSSLPWPQKGDAVNIPLGTMATVETSIANLYTGPGYQAMRWGDTSGAYPTGDRRFLNVGDLAQTNLGDDNGDFQGIGLYPTNLFVNLEDATAATINSLRLAFQTQKLLERDARGGSRYVEQLLSHFGVRSPDYRLQRPEYLGGSKIPITVNPIAQTAAYDAEPADAASALGNLGAEMHASGSKKTFTYAATEHGYIIGVAVVRATPTYQQGTRRHWRRQTRFDYYFPVFAMLGEQAVATQEIYQPANNAPANATWGYQERWAEYRYTPNEITGVLRSTAAQPLDWWHYAEEFGTEPALNAAFILDKTKETLARSLATAPSAQWSAQIIMDIQHDSTVGRLMPTYSVPGLIDHF